MRKIWIDGYEANVPQRLGSGQLAFHLLKNIEQLDQKNDYTIFLPDQPMKDLPKERKGWKYKVLPIKTLWTRIALPTALYTAQKKPDVFYSLSHYIPRFCPAPIKRVVNILDLAYFHFPDMFTKKDLWKLTNWSEFSILHADHIVAISQATINDLEKHYQIPADKVTLAYPGHGPYQKIAKLTNLDKIKEKYKIEGQYFIFISTIQPRKNLIRLIEAFKEIKDYKLVISGKTTGQGQSGWMFEETLNKPKELGIEDKIIFAGFVPDDDLNVLLNGAIAYIQPSLYEGFGIPVVDAMRCGKPVIVSNVSSLPEIVGDAGILIDPYSVDSIKAALEQIINNPKLRDSLGKKALQQSEKFSWQKMAQVVIKVLEEV